MNTEKLLVHPKAFVDESISGYLLRLAELNGFKRPYALFEGAGIRFNGPSQLHTCLTDTAMQTRLAAFINRPAADLHHLAYRFVKSTKRPTTIVWGQLALPASTLRMLTTCVCPSCLNDVDYARQEWDWTFSTACPRHGCLLLAVCPGCATRISRYRAGVSRCNCGYDFRQAASVPCSTESTSYFQSLVIGRELNCVDADARLAVWAALAVTLTEAELQSGDQNGFAALPLENQHMAMSAAHSAIQSGDVAGLIGKSAAVRFANFSALGPRYAIQPFAGLVEKMPYILQEGELERIAKALVDTSVVSRSFEVAGHTLSTSEVSYIFNISERVASELATDLALSITGHEANEERRSWLFDIYSVVKLLEKLRHTACPDI